jgi:hypothetical protein
VYLLAPLCHQVKECDLQNFRLENGLKLWQALWEYRHPDARCFTVLCKTKPSHPWAHHKKSHCGDVFIGRKSFSLESTKSPYSCVFVYFWVISLKMSISQQNLVALLCVYYLYESRV